MRASRFAASSRVIQPRSAATTLAMTAKPDPPVQTRSSLGSMASPVRSRARPQTGCAPSQKNRKVWRWTRSMSAASGKPARGLMFFECLPEAGIGWQFLIPASDGGGLLFRGLYRNRGPGAGRQALAFGVFDQVEDPREKASLCVRPADIDDCRARQFLDKNINDQGARFLFEVIDGFVEQYPPRLMQQEAGEGELVLFLAGQYLFQASVA